MADITPLRGEGRTVGRITGLWGELMSEFFGVFVLIAFGDGVVAMAVAALPGSGRTAGPTVIFQAAGDWLLITWGWAMAVAFGVWVAGGVSGAHLNPAVTLAFAVRRRFSWRKVAPYWAAQIVGAFAGAALVLLVYNSAINAFNLANHTPRSGGHALSTFAIFATFPAPYFHGTIAGPLVDQIVGTAFLLIFVVALIDLRNTAVGSNLAPLAIGLAVAAIGMSYGANAGYAINPARDFGPRLLAFFAGWGHVALPGTYNSGTGFAFSNYFWIPIVGPLIGGVVGIVLYDLFIGDVLHARLKKAEEVEGPIPETAEVPSAREPAGADAETAVPEARRPDTAERRAESPDRRAGT
ncbi:MAG TPA: MIP/aquaporin family protein [Trebonia sp.]|jgi:glycerol uptake facilitator protein|nr:MIP/aquaporin family protein [Trebonia sp.]